MTPMDNEGLITPATEESTEPHLIELPGERDKPAFDFGEGELRDKVNKLKETLRDKKILPGQPTPDEGTEANPEAEGKPITGDGIDWTQFDLRQDIAHLYPLARIVDTPQGPKWAVMLDEFLTREKNVNPTFDKDGRPRRQEKSQEAFYMGDFVTELLTESPDQGCTHWKLVAFMPGSMTGMAQVIFQRKKQVGLPDPKMIETPEDTVVAPPQDTELTDVERAAAQWAGEPVPEDAYTSEIDPAVEGADYEGGSK